MSIRKKLLLVILFISGLAVVIVFAGFITYEYISYREILVDDLRTKADIIAENINVALAFRDSSDASRVLRSLSSQPHIIAAAVYDQEKMLFATYVRDGRQELFPEEPEEEGWRFEEDAVVLYKPILVNGIQRGTIYLRKNLQELEERFWSYIQIAFLVLLGSFAVSLLVASRLERSISRPIMDLADTARQVSEGQDYSIRSTKMANDETGVLADAFNQMLAKIHERETNLRQTNEAMSNEIAERIRAEKTLKGSEERKEAILATALDGIITINQEGLIIEFNPAAEKLFGYARQEVMGKGMAELIIPPHLRERHHNGLNHYLATGEGPVLGKHIEITAMRANGTEFPVELSIVRVGKETPPIFTGFVRDITHRKKAEAALQESENRYRTTLDHMMEGCQIIGVDWRYLYVNDAAAKQGRRTKEELLRRTITEVYPGIETTPMFEHLQRCMAERVPHRMENEFRFPDGTTGWFNLSLEPVPEGTFILSEDITSQKQLSEELKKHREHLEELVNERTAQLKFANKELEAFSYSASHDLRAPLRHINGFVELLVKNQEHLDPKSQRYLSTISESAKHMGRLIDDLLTFSRMGRAEMQKTKVPIRNLIAEVVEQQKTATNGKAIKWKIDSLPDVQADPSMLRLVFQNLIDNAIKYSSTSEKPVINIGVTTNGNENVFYVRDNGVGFDMKYADKLFGVFQRLHRAEEFEGTGIGLANVRRIIERHGGRTWAEGEVGKGATVYFSLPKTETVVKQESLLGSHQL